MFNLSMEKKIKVVIGLFFGFVLGVPSIEEIFQLIFIDQFKQGNPYALFGLIPAFFVGLLAFFNSISIIAGYNNLKEAWDDLN